MMYDYSDMSGDDLASKISAKTNKNSSKDKIKISPKPEVPIQ